MTKAKLLLLVSLALVFAAGAALGRLSARHGAHRGRGSWLTRELALTAEQQAQMRDIWSAAMEPQRNSREERRRLQEERDAALRALLTEDQAAQYDSVLDRYRAQMDALSEKREAAFQEAVARTKEILTPEQRRKYEDVLSRMPERGPRRGPEGGRSGGRSGDRPPSDPEGDPPD